MQPLGSAPVYRDSFSFFIKPKFNPESSVQLQVCLSMYELLLPPDLKGLKMIRNIRLIFAYHSQEASLVFNLKININFVNRNRIEIKVTIVFLQVNARGGSKNPAASRIFYIAAVINGQKTGTLQLFEEGSSCFVEHHSMAASERISEAFISGSHFCRM